MSQSLLLPRLAMEYLKPRSLQLEQLQLTLRQERLRRQLQLQLKQLDRRGSYG
nr:MAG TPA: hypothetical protein [Caudoviricetes sp.]